MIIAFLVAATINNQANEIDENDGDNHEDDDDDKGRRRGFNG